MNRILLVDITRRELLMAFALAGVGAAAPAGLLATQTLAAKPSPSAALDHDDQKLIAAMAEGIIPNTDTPGAIGAGVPAFIAMMYADWLLPQEQIKFREGLATYRKDARLRFRRDFVDLNSEQQLALLNAWDATAASSTHKPPFTMFRALAIVGYYTSQVGQEIELKMSLLNAGLNDPLGPRSPPMPVRI